MLEWLDSTWNKLNQVRIQGRLPHALLVIGVDGIGKLTLAEQLASSLLCEAPDEGGQPCGVCSACGWLRAGTHPDLLQLAPEETGKAIKVDQIRALCAELGMTSHAGRHKVAIIQPADAMNTNAANSLLKTLEEPTDDTLLVLLTALPGKLPATIRSRCQQLRLAVPGAAAAQRWLEARDVSPQLATQCLQMTGGAPLQALELAKSGLDELRDQRLDELCRVFAGQLDPVLLAAQWMDKYELQSLRWWLGWLGELIGLRLANRVPVDPNVAQKLRKFSEKVDSRQVYELADGVLAALNSIGSGLNRQLVLEDLLVGWTRMASIDHKGSRLAR